MSLCLDCIALLVLARAVHLTGTEPTICFAQVATVTRQFPTFTFPCHRDHGDSSSAPPSGFGYISRIEGPQQRSSAGEAVRCPQRLLAKMQVCLFPMINPPHGRWEQVLLPCAGKRDEHRLLKRFAFKDRRCICGIWR